MFLLNYASDRVKAVLAEIDRLKGSEFPYPHSKDALLVIKGLFDDIHGRLKSLDENTDPDYVRNICALSLRTLYRCLPLLGFILRSTNVRNSFEVFKPLLDISKKMLELAPPPHKKETKLILSSEWSYSPITYQEPPDIPGFVLIGLPAPESGNPLLIPLSGHELGHSVWARYDLESHFKPLLQKEVLKCINDSSAEYKRIFPAIEDLSQLETDLFARQTWFSSLAWLLRQAQESFCDFIGVGIYGTSFLNAFAYLLAPNISYPRSVNYPNAIARIHNLITATKELGFTVPKDYEDMFQDRPDPTLLQADKFQLFIADKALTDTVDKLIQKAKELLLLTNIPKPNEEESKRIYERFRQVAPSPNCKSLADILDAAWKAYADTNLWSNMPQVLEEKDRILQNLVLKNIEILDVEHILEE